MIIGFIALAQIEELPAKIGKAFYAKYPEATNVLWLLNEKHYEIDFEISPDSYTTIYSEDGKWMETAKMILDIEVPDEAIDAVIIKYPNHEISYAEFVEKVNGEKFYRLFCSNENAFFIINVTVDGIILYTDKKVSATDFNANNLDFK
jgi:hypothetical protein